MHTKKMYKVTILRLKQAKIFHKRNKIKIKFNEKWIRIFRENVDPEPNKSHSHLSLNGYAVHCIQRNIQIYITFIKNIMNQNFNNRLHPLTTMNEKLCPITLWFQIKIYLKNGSIIT